jgi:hypothetical protein
MSDLTYEFFIGTAVSMSLTCKQSDGSVFDLTGYSVQGLVKTSPSAETETLDLEPTIPTPANGVVSINVDSSSVPAGVYGFDVQVTEDGEVPIVIASGKMKFKKKNTPNPEP